MITHLPHRPPVLPLAPNRRWLAACALGLLAGCASLPRAEPPPATALTSVAASSLPTNPAAAWPGDGAAGNWWHALGDPQLDALIAEGLAGNPDIAEAAARLRKAAASVGAAQSALIPSLTGNGQAGEARQSLELGYPPQFLQFLPHGWFNEGNISANFGFDPDLWGKNRALLAAATSQREAAAIDAAGAAITLSAAIADAYVGLAGDLATQAAAQATLANRTATRDLIARRFALGRENRGALASAEANLAAARGDVAAAAQQVATRRDQLAALVGAGPDRGLRIAPPQLAPLGARDLPPDVTTNLVGRRADIAAARARAAAAVQQVRAARAAFFPSIRLSALIGQQALGFANLFKGGATYGTVGPAISLPIFDGGALRAQYRGARADADTVVAQYNRTVVNAYQQLADAIVTRQQQSAQRDAAAAALAASEQAVTIARARYSGGLAGYLELLSAEGQMIGARNALARADTGARQADIALVRALGGGFGGQLASGDAPQGGKP